MKKKTDLCGEWKKLFKSFFYAFCGIAHGIKQERNLRIHLSATILVWELAWICRFTSLQFALLFLLCGSVISAELFNTAIEALTDLTSPAYTPLAKIAKDVAAGAVLVLAITAVGIAVFLFGTGNKLRLLWAFLTGNPLGTVLLGLEVILLFGFVFCWKANEEKKPKEK